WQRASASIYCAWAISRLRRRLCLSRRVRSRREQEEVTLDDGICDVDELAPVVLRVVAEHLECVVGVDRMARHEDALRLLDCRPSAEGALEALVLAEALQRDVD